MSYKDGLTNSGSGTAASCNMPTNSAGDVALFLVWTTGAGQTITPPAGWAEVTDSPLSFGADFWLPKVALFQRTLGASEPSSYTATLSVSRGWETAIVVYEGHSIPFDDIAGELDGAATNHDTTAVSNSDATYWHVAVVGLNNYDISAFPTGYVERLGTTKISIFDSNGPVAVGTVQEIYTTAGWTNTAQWAIILPIASGPSPATVSAKAAAVGITAVKAAVTPGAATIAAKTGALSTDAPQAAMTAGAVSITAAAGAAAVQGQQAAVAPGPVSLAGLTGAVAVAAPQAAVTVTAEIVINAHAGALTISGQHTAVSPGAVSISSATGAAVVSGQKTAVSLVSPVAIEAVSASIGLSPLAATVESDVAITAAPGALGMAGLTAVVVPGSIAINGAVAAAAISGQAAVITADLTLVVGDAFLSDEDWYTAVAEDENWYTAAAEDSV